MQDKKINLDEDLSKEDLEDMKNIFTQDNNEVLDIPSMPKRKAEYTYEDLKAVHDNPHQPTEDEIKNTFIEDDGKVDISKLKL